MNNVNNQDLGLEQDAGNIQQNLGGNKQEEQSDKKLSRQTLIVMIVISLLVLSGAAFVLYNMSQPEQEKLGSDNNVCSSDFSESSRLAVERRDNKLCECIEDIQLKEKCMDDVSDALVYQSAQSIDQALCNRIKDEEKKEECSLLIESPQPPLDEMASIIANKGSYQFMEKEYGRKAADMFKEILENDENNLRALLGLGYAYEIMGEYDLAKANYEKALALEPNNAAIHNRLGHMYDLSEGIEKAEPYYQKALELNSDFINAKYNIARVYVRQGKNEEALLLFDELYKSADLNNRTRAEIGYMLFSMSFEKGNLDLAKEYIDEAVTVDKSLPMVWVGKGISAFFEIGNLTEPIDAQKLYEESLAYFDQAAKLYQYQTAAYYWKGRAVLAAGDKEGALSLFTTALQVIENDVSLMSDQRALFKKEIEDYMEKAKVAKAISKFLLDDIIIKAASAKTCCSFWGWENGVWTNHNSCVTWCADQASENALFNSIISEIKSGASTAGHNWKISGNTVTCNNGNSATYVPIDMPSPSETGGDPAPITPVCTGVIPTNAAMCRNDNAWLSADTTRSLVDACTNAKCEYVCLRGFKNVNGTCVHTCLGTLPSSVKKCAGDEDGLTDNIRWKNIGTKEAACTAQRKCEYYDPRGKLESWKEEN